MPVFVDWIKEITKTYQSRSLEIKCFNNLHSSKNFADASSAKCTETNLLLEISLSAIM